jgi:hypothetical protein
MIKIDNNLNFSTGDLRYLKLDQTAPQIISNGAPVIQYGIEFDYVTDTNTLDAGFYATVQAGTGLEIGAYRYYWTYTTAVGETGTEYQVADLVTTTAGNQQVLMTVPVSTDPRVTGRKLYRTTVGTSYWLAKLIPGALTNDNTSPTYLDTTPDASLDATQQAYYRVNTTNNSMTRDGLKAIVLDKNLHMFGYDAGQHITYGGGNFLFGWKAGHSITTGSENGLCGNIAGQSINSGSNNYGFGRAALAAVTTGGQNSGFGQNVMTYGTGSENAIFGYYAGTNLYPLGGQNTIMGAIAYGQSRANANTVSYNTAIGYYSGTQNIGARNVFLGAYSGGKELGSDKLYISNSYTQNLIWGDFATRDLTLYGDVYIANPETLASESLTNPNLTSGTSWSRVLDFSLTADTAVFTYATGGGAIQQASGDMAIAGKANKWYRFTYVISAVTGVPSAYISTSFAKVATYLVAHSAGSHSVEFQAASSPGIFEITGVATSTATFTIDSLSLKEILGGNLSVPGTLGVVGQLTLGSGAFTNYVIQITNQSTNNTSGQPLFFSGAKAMGTGTGGPLIYYSGDADTLGAGGYVDIKGGNGGTSSSVGGDSPGGECTFYGGDAISGNNDGGDIRMIPGAGFGTGTYGKVFMRSLGASYAIFDTTLLGVSDHSYQFPNADGILALTSDVSNLLSSNNTWIGTQNFSNDIDATTIFSIPDPEFDDSAKWDLVGGATVSGGVLAITSAGGTCTANPTPGFTIGRSYKVIYKLDSISAGPATRTLNIGGTTYTLAAAGTYTVYVTPASDSIVVTSTSCFSGSTNLDYIRVTEYSNATLGNTFCAALSLGGSLSCAGVTSTGPVSGTTFTGTTFTGTGVVTGSQFTFTASHGTLSYIGSPTCTACSGNWGVGNFDVGSSWQLYVSGGSGNSRINFGQAQQLKMGFNNTNAVFTLTSGTYLFDKGVQSTSGSLVAFTGFGCNSKSAQTAYASGGSVSTTGSALVSYGYTTAAQADGIVTLVNNIRAALVANGIMS